MPDDVAAELGLALAFYSLAALTVVSALSVVLLRNIFHAALFLVLCFAGVAGLYITLNAELLAAVQVLIYAGAIAVLLIFAVMLTRDVPRGSLSGRLGGSAFLAALLITATLVVVFLNTEWGPLAAQAPQYGIEQFAEALFTTYVLPFEVVSVLLLVAMIGAIILARD